MRKRGKIGSLAMVLLLVLVAAACGGNAGGGAAATGNGGPQGGSSGGRAGGQSADRVKIEFWHTYSDAEEEVLLNEVKPLFEQQHPNIELVPTRMPYEGLKQQVIAGVAGDAAPDLMRMDIIWVPEFAKMGALMRLDDKDGFADIQAAVFEGPLATNFYNGGYYGLPLNTNTKVAIYNKAILDDLGIEPPKTMDELADAARKAKAEGYPGGITIGGAHAWAALPYFWSLGGKLTNGDYTKVDGYLNSPESVKALETILAWNAEGLLSPPILGGEPGSWDGMKNGEYLMIDDGPWFYSILMNDESFNVLEDTEQALIPAGAGGSVSVVGGENLVIFSNSKHPAEAWTFAKWMLTEEPQKLMAKVGMIPTNRQAAADETVMRTPYNPTYIEQLQTALPRTPIPQWGEMESIFNLAFEKALRGELGAKEALDDAARQIEAVLQQ